MEDEIDPFIEDEGVFHSGKENNQQVGGQGTLPCSPIYNMSSSMPKFNKAVRRRSRFRESGSSIPLPVAPVMGQIIVTQSPPAKCLLPDFTTSPTPTKMLQNSPPYDGLDSDDDMFCSITSNTCSDQVMPSALNALLSGPEPADVSQNMSWTSSMATPLASNVTYSNLNTEERKVFLPSDDCNWPAKPRALFSPDLNDTGDCHSLNLSSDTEYLQALKGERTPKLRVKRNSHKHKVYTESPLARTVLEDINVSPNQKVTEGCEPSPKGSPILSGSSGFKKSPNHSGEISRGDEDLFGNTEDTPSAKFLRNQANDRRDHSIAESTPNAAMRKPPLNEVNESRTAESFLADISVSTLVEVCEAHELKETTTSRVKTPLKQSDNKRKRSLFSSNLAANSNKAVFKVPESKPMESERGPIEDNPVDDCIPDDSFMDHLAAMNTSIFSDPDTSAPVTKVQSIKSFVSHMKRFCYSTDQKLNKIDLNVSKPSESKTLMKEILSSVLAQESSTCAYNKPKTFKPNGNLVVFSQLQEELREGQNQENHLEHPLFEEANKNLNLFTSAVQKGSPTMSFEEINSELSTCSGFQTARGNQIELSQEAISKGLNIFKDALEGIESGEPASFCSKSNLQEGASPKAQNSLVAGSDFADVQAEEEVKQLLQLVNDGEDFNTWHDIEQPFSCKVKDADYPSVESKSVFNSAIFQDLGNSECPSRSSAVSSEPPMSGFSTANGKNVSVSQESLAQAQLFFSKCMDELNDHSEEMSDNNKTIQNEKRITLEYSKAETSDNLRNEKPVKVSCQVDRPTNDTSNKKVSPGFSAASGKNNTVSEKSLAQAQQILSECGSNDLSGGNAEGKESAQNVWEGSVEYSRVETSQNLKKESNDNVSNQVGRKRRSTSDKTGFKVPNKRSCLTSVPSSDYQLQSQLSHSKANRSSEMSSLSHMNSASGLHEEKPFTSVGVTDPPFLDDAHVNISDEVLSMMNNLFHSSPRRETHEGFSTAAGKIINVSQEAQDRVKNLFDDLPGVTDISLSTRDDILCTSSVRKAIHESCVSSDSDKKKEDLPLSKSDMLKNCEAPLFTTANGKGVNFSKQAISKMKNLFDNLCDETVSSQDMQGNVKNASILCLDEETKGFSTASGKMVNVTEKAVTKGVSLFADIDPLEAQVNKMNTQIINNSKVSTSHGFSTASGKTVEVSREALSKVKSLFENIPDYSKFGMDEVNNSSSCDTAGFSTASRKTKLVSKHALNEARNLSEDLEIQCGMVEVKDRIQSKSGGFSTASGKIVNVSKEAIEKVKNLFEELPTVPTISLEPNKHQAPLEWRSLSQGVNDNNEQAKSESNENLMQGFSTASGRTVSVSKEAWKKVKSIFDAEDFAIEPNPRLNGKDSPSYSSFNNLVGEDMVAVNGAMSSVSASGCTGSLGFSTAGGRRVQISEEAVKKAKCLFDDLPPEPVSKEEPSKSSANLIAGKSSKMPLSLACDTVQMSGFATAGGKAVNISKEALTKAKNLFEDLPSESMSGVGDRTVSSISSGRIKARDIQEEDSGVFMSHECSLKEPLSSKSSKDSSKPDKMILFCNNHSEKILKESGRTLSKQISNQINFADCEKTSLTQEITASTAALLADDEFFNGADLFEGGVKLLHSIKTSPSMATDRHRRLKPVFSSMSEKKCEKAVPRSPILVKSGRPRRGRLSLSSNAGSRVRPLAEGSQSYSQGCNDSSWTSLPSKDSACNLPTSSVSSVASKPVCQESFSQSVNECSNSSIKLPSPRQLFAQETMSPDILEDPTIKIVQNVSLVRDSGSKSDGSSDTTNIQVSKLSQPSPIMRKASTRSCVPQVLGFKTPIKTPSKEQLKRCPSSPAQNPPESKRKKSLSNLYVSHIFRNSDSLKSNSRSLRPEVAEMRRRAAEEQRQLVENYAELKGEMLLPQLGRWFAWKVSPGESLTKLMKMTKLGQPQFCSFDELEKMGLRISTLSVSAANSAQYRFSAWDHYSQDVCRENVAGLPVGDGALLVLDLQGTAGVEEFERSFLACPGVDPSLVPSGWIRNHYRWLVWKLAAVEWRFPCQLGGQCLTPNILMLQLKYRYDREIDRCERPALRRILEHDDSAAKRMVLCVAGIINQKDNNQGLGLELELSDGWYSLKASVDLDMQHRVRKGVIKVGTKLIMHGAELLNCPEGCSPLQVSSEVRLKLCSNSTRRARWYAKLGFQNNPGPMVVPLSSILSSGGVVSCVSVYVARVYPLVFIEKTKDKTIVRSQRAESKEVSKCERKRQQIGEMVYSQVQAELQEEQRRSNRRNVKFSTKNLCTLTSGEELADIIENSSDPLSVQSMLSDEQKSIIADYQRSKQEEFREAMEARVRLRLSENSNHDRQITPVLKVRLQSVQSGVLSCSAILSVWRPSEDMSSIFKEGQKLRIFGSVANGLRCGELQISANRSTRYLVNVTSEIKADLVRKVLPLSSLSCFKSLPRFGELDIVGLVLRVGPAPQSSENTTHFQTVYLTDGQQNLAAISFWGGLKEFGVEDLIISHSYIAACNLQWRGGPIVRAIPCVYASELALFSTNPRQGYLQAAVQELRHSLPSDVKVFYKECEEKLDMLLSQRSSSSVGSPRTPDFVPLASILAEQNQTNSSSAAQFPRPTNEFPVGPLKAQRKLAMDQQMKTPPVSYGLSPAERLAKLEMYGEPPPLPPINICKPRKSLRQSFKAPRRTDSPSVEGKKMNVPHNE